MRFREVPIGAAFDVRNGATPASDEERYWDGDIPWVTPADLGGLQGREIGEGNRAITPEGFASCGTQMVPAGSIILSIRAPIGHMAITKNALCFNQGCRGLTPRRIIRTDFAYWALLARRPQLEAAGQGTTFIELGRGKLRADRIPIPDIGTQEAVADFLDRETARIDRLINKKQRLTGLLRDKQVLVIDEVVTQGLDRQRTMQSTAIPWLPEIPHHWKLQKAKYLFKEVQRPPQDDDEIITAFRDGQVTLRRNRRSEGYTFAVMEVGYQHIQSGDLVIHTMDAFAGAIGVSDSNGKATGEYTVCESRGDSVNSEYYARLLRCMARKNYIFILCPSVRERAPRFRFVRFAPILLPVPPREEQDAIVQRLTPFIEQIRIAREKTELSLDRLREFRSALVTAAVTGQIDTATWRKRGLTDRRLDEVDEEAALPEPKQARA